MRFTILNPRGIPAGIPVLTLPDGTQLYEGDEHEFEDAEARALLTRGYLSGELPEVVEEVEGG